MDYEKKYKEALEIMEKYLKSCNAGVIAENTIKEAFPELKESKDEKIRKSIWQVLSRGESTRVLNALGIQLSEAFDWLEKQKNTTSVTSIHEAYESGFNNGINTVVQEPEEYGLLKEQKSACSEEDEKIRKELIEFLCELSKLGKNTNFDRWSKADCANWLAWLEKQCEQKPAEWSEVDEVMIELITDSLKCLLEEHRNSIADSQIQKEIAWLKSLSPNKKQEWSGVNEKVVMCCKFLRDALLCIDYDDSHKNDIEKCIQWLNSLRPQNQ